MCFSLLVVLLTCFGVGQGSTTTAAPRNITNGTTVITRSTGKLTTTLLPTTPCVVQTVDREWVKEDFPDPQVDIGKCGMDCRKSWICDPNNVITDKYYSSQIEISLSRIRSNGRCGCASCTRSGYKISVALVNGMKFQSWESVSSSKKKQRAQEFASYLRSTAWHPSGTCADDVVIFVSRGDRQVQTSTGPLARDAIDTDCIEYVYNSVKSDLSSGYYGKAVNDMVKKYEQAILTGKCQDNSLSAGAIVGIVFGIIAFFVIVFVVACVCCRGGCGGGGGGGVFYSSHHHHGGWGGGGSSGGGGGFSGFSSGDGGGGGGGGF